MKIPDEESMKEYYNICQQLSNFKDDVNKVITNPTYCLPFLQPGRLFTVKRNGVDFGLAIVLNIQKVFTKSKSHDISKLPEGSKNYVDALINCKPGSTEADPIPCAEGEKGELILVGLEFSSISSLSTIRLNTPKEVKSVESRQKLGKSLQDVKSRFKTGLPLLDPVKDMRINDANFVKISQKIKVLEERKVNHDLHSSIDIDERYELYATKMKVKQDIETANGEINKAEAVLQLEELKCRLRLLRRLGYTTENDVIEMKGRVACEISAGDELVLTEMIFNGVFNDLSVEQTAALLSCFACDERLKEIPPIKAELAAPLRALRETAKRVATVANECKITLDPNEYVQSFRTEMMGIVYAWALGAKFSEICKMTDIFEGSIIRSMRRLEELLRQLVTAAKAIGNLELEEKFEGCKFIILTNRL
jgi:ATP-dependent RNA helicase DOB1